MTEQLDSKEKKYVFYQTLARASCEFFNDNFLGAVDWSFGELKPYKTYISFEKYTYFLRTLFDFIFGESLIKASFSTPGEQLEVSLTWKNRELDSFELKELSLISRSSGFEFEYSTTGRAQSLVLKHERVKETAFSIYAANDETIKYLLVSAFENFKKDKGSQV